jgi:tripartite-type tricarboxylate transporter receptor subunit TctC
MPLGGIIGNIKNNQIVDNLVDEMPALSRDGLGGHQNGGQKNEPLQIGRDRMPALTRITLSLTASVFAITAIPAAAQQSSSQPLKIIVAFPAGGFADNIARIVAQKLEGKLRQTVVVENRGGAAGNIAARAVSQASPDGQTVLITTTASAISPTLYKNPGYKADDLRVVSIVGSAPESIIVHPDNPANDLKEFIAKAKTSKLTYGTSGIGTGSYISSTYLFKELAKVDLTHVPFQGGAGATNAILGNHVNSIALTVSPMIPHIQQGKMKALGIASSKRIAALPKVPTYMESGFSDFTAASWVGLFVPTKTSDAQVDRLNNAVNEALKESDVQQRFARVGLDPMFGNAKVMAVFYQDEIAKWGKMVTTLGMKIE